VSRKLVLICWFSLVGLRQVRGELKEEERLPVRFVPLMRPPDQGQGN
jgi:hypothetical protein